MRVTLFMAAVLFLASCGSGDETAARPSGVSAGGETGGTGGDDGGTDGGSDNGDVEPDTTPPETTLSGGPSGTTSSTNATFRFVASERDVTFECRLGAAAWVGCTSPRTLAGLAGGAHVFEVRARDKAGNADATPARRAWTVDTAVPPYALAMEFLRIAEPGLDPFRVVVTLTQGGTGVAGRTLTTFVPRGMASPVTDLGGGGYAFTVTPAATGVYPVTVTYAAAAVTREALVLTTYADGVGQPRLVPGLVNTAGYEDGITITPDGQWLFVQYGPLYFSGIFNVMAICAEAGWSLYRLATCEGKTDSDWVFETLGPYAAPLRPGFPSGAIAAGRLQHIALTIPGVADGLALFPTVFYGFRRQADGSFAEPFKVAFNDARGTNGPFGLSFQMLDAGHARFVMAWDDYFDKMGDDQAEVYAGELTLGVSKNLGDVVYSGDFFASITPYVTAVSLPTATGAQGNPHLDHDAGGAVRSIWTDDEQLTNDLFVYRLTAGAYPGGTWEKVALPPKINTAAGESQPFFTGSHLVLNRDVTIVAHPYLGGDYALDAAWGDAVTLLASGDTSLDGIYGVGEPTLAVRDGRTYLYFAYVRNRGIRPSGRYDFDLGAAEVEIPNAYR